MSRDPFARLADGTRWPIDTEAMGAVAWRLRYGEHADYRAAGIVEAYMQLLGLTTREQRDKLRLIRAARAAAPAPIGEE